jgi:hypothetical protein
MDVILALNIASAILAVVEFYVELSSTSVQPTRESSLLQYGEYLENKLDKIRTLRDTLSAVHGSAIREVPADILNSALQNIALSSIEDSGNILPHVESMLRELREGEKSKPWIDNKAGLRSVIERTFREGKLEHISRSVTFHVSSMIRFAYFIYRGDEPLRY